MRIRQQPMHTNYQRGLINGTPTPSGLDIVLFASQSHGVGVPFINPRPEMMYISLTPIQRSQAWKHITSKVFNKALLIWSRRVEDGTGKAQFKMLLYILDMIFNIW